MKILILSGGNGSEREVSLRSAESVATGLRANHHAVTILDTRLGSGAISEAVAACDVVLPIIHGEGGEDGSIQHQLDVLGKPYLGSGAEVSELCFDKARFKELMEAQHVRVPFGELVTATSLAGSKFVRQPFVLKPEFEGSSVGVMIARRLPYDRHQAEALLARYETMLIEELVEGVELTVPVLGDRALPVIEIIPPAGGEFDFENKYNGASAELCPPKHVSAEQQALAQDLALKVHRLAGCRHLSRTDMILRPNGELVVLEINTMPGMTSQSLFPKSAAVAGLEWNAFVAELVRLALA